jgi:phage N-6-adenine-methyltransferase
MIKNKMAVMYSSATDVWATPQDFFDEVNAKYNFTLDACANTENAKCKKFFSPEQDGLKQNWGGRIWMNPPYGRVIGNWVEKAYQESKNGALVVALLPARTDTRWFHNYIYKKKGVKIHFLKGRLKFGDAKEPAPFPCILVEFNLSSKQTNK